MAAASPLKSLREYFAESFGLRHALGLLSWDQETHMPASGGALRAGSIAALTSLLHRRQTAQSLGDLIERCEDAELSPRDRALVREARRDYDRTRKIPEALAADIARSGSEAQQVWSKARAAENPQSFLPHLEKLIGLMRRQAEVLGYEEHPYDALLDGFEPGARLSSLRPILDGLRSGLKQRLPGILARPPAPPPSWTGRAFPVKAQRGFNKKLLAAIGFDPDRGRLDESAHPFTDGLSPRDVRLTTRYSETDWLMAITGTLHEGGHGLYEQGLPAEEAGTPLGEAVSLGVHESQSRLWENLVGRSPEFWEWAFPIAKDFFPEQLADSSPEEVVRELQRVRPTFIRVEADEATYNLHVCLRFDLEVALFSGELEVDGLADAWNAGMKSLLGITPSKPSEGFLQDVHWSCGLYGYFPTYSLGNLYSAQLMRAAENALPGLRPGFARGEFSGLREWLRQGVHAFGRELPAGELMEKASGRAFSGQPFLDHLDARYAG